jgi:hypothetical protein
MQLTREQIERFDRDGFLVIPDLLTPDEVSALQHETEHYHETLAGGVPPEVDVTWEPSSSPPRVQQVLNAECLSAELARIIRSERLRGVVEPLLGPDVGLFHVKFIMKPPQVGGLVPWHQDFAYWTGEADAPIQLNCMVYLDDATRENGALEVLARSQRAGLERHAETTKGSFVHELDASHFAGEAVSLPGKAGTGILFGPLLKHASPPNTTAKSRRSFTAVYSVAGQGHPVRQVYWSRQHDVSALARELKDCPVFIGEGPHAGQCDGAYQRRELWKLATAAARGTVGAWVEVVMSPTLGESLEWFAARRPQDAPLVRFDTYLPTELSSARVTIVRPGGLTGPTPDDIRDHVPSSLALLHIEGGLYFPTQRILESFGDRVQAGTVLLIDRVFAADEAIDGSADALNAAAFANGWRIEALARAGRALAAVVSATGTSTTPGIALRSNVTWVPTVSGIQLVPASAKASAGSVDEVERPSEPSVTGIQKARRAAGMLKRALGMVGEWEDFFPVQQIPAFAGDGPRGNLCPTHARRRELWRYAVQLVDARHLPWCEFGVGEGESLDWFLLHKADNLMLGFDTFEGIPEPWLGMPVGHWKSTPYASSRADLVIARGAFDQSLKDSAVRARLADGLGFVHIDCDLYSSTKTILEGIAEFLRPGTVLVFDEFYGFGGWQECEAGAFREFVQDAGISLEYVARSDFQVAMRLRAPPPITETRAMRVPDSCSTA